MEVQRQAGNARHLRFWQDGKESAELTRQSPYWMEVGAFDGQGKPVAGLPDKDGYFERMLPNALLDDSIKTLRIDWIDAYQ